MKNANGRIAAIVSDTWKSAMMSGTNGPRIFVRKEITKNTKNTTATRNRLLPPVPARTVDVIVIRSYLVDVRRVATLRWPLEGRYTTGTWLMLFFGSIQNDSFTKRLKISRGKMGGRSIGSTFGGTVWRPGVP